MRPAPTAEGRAQAGCRPTERQREGEQNTDQPLGLVVHALLLVSHEMESGVLSVATGPVCLGARARASEGRLCGDWQLRAWERTDSGMVLDFPL